MKNLKKVWQNWYKEQSGLQKFLNRYWPIFVALLVVFLFFWKFFILKLIPLPGDFIVGVYYPWLDYKWGYVVGVPVKNPITTDVVSLIFPEQMLSIDLMKSGQWPLWNPYILAGTPLFANLQTASFSPTNFLYFVFGKLNAWSFQIMLQHFLSIVFAFVLLRKWKVSKIGSLFGGIAFAFTGFNMIFSQWNGHTLTSAFIPLIIFFQYKLLKFKKPLYGIGFSICLFLQLLSGYPQTCLYTAIAGLLLYLVLLVKKEVRFLSKATFLLIVFSLFAASLSAIQLFPSIELWSLSQRSYELTSYVDAFLPWKKLITFIAPDYFGNHSTANYWGPQDYTSNTAYLGVVVFVFALFSIKKLKKNTAVLYLWLLVTLSLILSFPTPIAVFFWKYNILGMQSSSAHRATILFTFSASMLAGYGLDSFAKIKNSKLLKYLLPSFLLLTSFGLYALLMNFLSAWRPNDFQAIIKGIPAYLVALRNIVLPFVFFFILLLVFIFVEKGKLKKSFAVMIVIILAVLELFRFGWKFTPFSPRRFVYPTTPVIEFLMSQEKPNRVTGNWVIPVNIRTPYELETLEGYETIHPLRMSQFIAALDSGRSGTTPIGRFGNINNDTSHLLDLVNTKYYLTHKYDKDNNPKPDGSISSRFDIDRFKLAFEDKSVAVMESVSSLPRAFMVYDWEVVSDDEEILDRMLNPNFSFADKIILEEDVIEIEKAVDKPIFDKIVFDEIKEQEIQIEVELEKDGLMFVSDAHFPGWKAYIDGVQTKIYRANFAFRAVPVKKGKHLVSFLYDPLSFRIGVGVSIATMLFLVGYILYEQKNKKRKKSS